jgi:hypothetical protein
VTEQPERPKTYYRTGKGSHRHASLACANVRRSVFTGDPVRIPAEEVANWPACEHCCDPAEVALNPALGDDGKCRNSGVANPRRLRSTCVDCGKEGAVNRSTGKLRAHAPLVTP